MIRNILFFIILLLLVLIESTLIAYPFVFILMFLLFMRSQTISTLIMVFIIGLILDSVRIIPFGITPMISFGLFFLLFLYNKALHLRGLFLILLACFAATMGYAFVAQYPFSPFMHMCVFVLLSLVLYKVSRKQRKTTSVFSPYQLV